MEKALLEEFYQRYYRQLFLYAVSLTGSREDAEDLVANTFVKALTTFRGGNIVPWLYKVLRNEFFDLYRKGKREVALSEDTLCQTDLSDPVIAHCIENEQTAWLYQQIWQLPRHEREVLLLTVQTDYSDRQIAEILALTVTHVRVLRHRAKKHILEQCKEEIL